MVNLGLKTCHGHSNVSALAKPTGTVLQIA